MKKLLHLTTITIILGLSACNSIPPTPETINLEKGEKIISAGAQGDAIYYLTEDSMRIKKLYHKSPITTKIYIFVEN